MFKNLINYIKDNKYLIGIYDNEIYIYNYLKIINIDTNNIVIDLDNKKIQITGKNISVIKLENKEILIKLLLEGINFYE